MAERYLALNEKYLRDGAELLRNGDYVQGGEKYWGAVATAIKVVATARDLRHAGHRDLRFVMKTLGLETGDDEYLILFRAAERLHENFYEDRLDETTVRQFTEQAARLVRKLEVIGRDVRR